MAGDRRVGEGRLIADRYRLRNRIGSGGAGTVWRAEDERLARPVAVKEIVWTASEPDASRRRCVREARAAARLHHPDVVRIYDVVEGDDRTWIVMELVEAPSLTKLVESGGPLEPRAVARLGLALADALVAAHAAGVVHRDVKPGNVLVAGDRPLLTDFGISRTVDDQTLTAAGTVLGTPAYLAPEQARGERVGGAADRYSLGATLYFAVEGAPPFRGATSMATASAVMSDPPRPAVRAGPLGPLLDDLLAKDPAARPDDDELRDRLRAIAAGPATSSVVDVRPIAAPTRRADGDAAATGRAAAVATGGRSGAGRAAGLVAGAALLVLVGVMGIRALQTADDPETPATDAPAVVAPPDATGGQAAAPADPGNPDEEGGEGDGGEEGPQDPPADAAATAPTDDDAEPAETAGPAAPDDTGPLPPLDAPVPDEWVQLAPDDAPYAVSHPPGWEVVERTERRTDVVDPETGAFLRLEWNDVDRDPVEDWELLSADFTERSGSYEELSIEEATFRGDDAAVWEYRYTSEGGVPRRAVNLGISKGDEYGLAVNLQAPVEVFDEVVEIWPAIVSSIELGPLPG